MTVTNRRQTLQALGAGVLLAGGAAGSAAAETGPPKTFVLVHGAWHGGWCYRDTAAELRRHGNTVFTPTLTGLGERSHLRADVINLDTHIQDIVNVFLFEELQDVVLVGHSYAGMVITGVADKVADRISALVYLDAFVPTKDGDSAAKLNPAGLSSAMGQMGQDGWSVPPRPSSYLGVKPRNQARVDRLCVPQPLAPSLQELRLTDRQLSISNRHFVWAKGWGGPQADTPMRPYYLALRNDPAWKVHVMDCGHDMMVDEPMATARLLMEV